MCRKGTVFNGEEMNNVEKALAAADETKALVIGSGVLNRAASLFKEQFPGKKAILVADRNTYAVAGERVREIFDAEGVDQEVPYIFRDPALYAEFKYVDELEAVVGKSDAIPVAVGSGTINDLTKLVSSRCGRRYMSVATAASMDGYTAFGASITFEGAKQTFSCPAPQALLADIDIIRRAPACMTAAGYADLLAKVTAGADWILADALGVEPIDECAWSIVQEGLKDALADPAGAARGDRKAISDLIEGLVLGGFAMQWARSSRPASGAEHQFSHLWDMEHHTYNGVSPSHGFKVAIGTLAVTRLYEQLMAMPIDRLDINACCAVWPEWVDVESRARAMFADTDFPAIGEKETRAKYVDRASLAVQLADLKRYWPEIRVRLARQLIPSEEIIGRLKSVGAPTTPEEIGISRRRLRDSFVRAQYIRRRFTVLDLALRANVFDDCLNALFGVGGIWEINE